MSYPPPPPPPATTTTSSSSSPYTVQSKDNAQLGAILADAAGATLYTLTNGGQPVACSGSCASTWPPLVIAAGARPTPGPGVTGLGTTNDANGNQVTDYGLPLYRYSGDAGPGDANGEGIISFGGTWHVVKVGGACTPGPLSPTPMGNVTRISGQNRDATAIAVSQSSFPGAGSAGAAVLASDTAFPDALAGTPLAVAKHAPLLLTPPAALDSAVAAEIHRVVPSGQTVFLLGGSSALAPGIDASIQSMGYTARRLSGADRFATAIAIADALGDPTTVLEATGLDFPDGLSAGAAAAKAGGAVLLTNGSQQTQATAAYLSAHPGTTRIAVGGPAATADPGATGVAGPDRFATATLVAQHFFSSPVSLGFASGTAFPDALSGGAAAGTSQAPLLLVPACGELPSSVTSYLGSVSGSVRSGDLFGGVSAVGDDVLAQLDQDA